VSFMADGKDARYDHYTSWSLECAYIDSCEPASNVLPRKELCTVCSATELY
jgi:hypothetical protein